MHASDLIRCAPLVEHLLADIYERRPMHVLAEMSSMEAGPVPIPAMARGTCQVTRFGAVFLDQHGRPGAACGAAEAGCPWNYGIWLCQADNWPGVWRLATRWINGVLVPALLAAGAHRAQAIVRADSPKAERFAGAFGMQREGVLRALGKGREDYIMYARTA